jgi:hypothetical protein
MKNKPYPALLRPSNLSNEIGKRVPKSRETIPLKLHVHQNEYSVANTVHILERHVNCKQKCDIFTL